MLILWYRFLGLGDFFFFVRGLFWLPYVILQIIIFLYCYLCISNGFVVVFDLILHQGNRVVKIYDIDPNRYSYIEMLNDVLEVFLGSSQGARWMWP